MCMGVQPLRMLLDTGATTCLISEAIAARIVRDGYGVWQGTDRFKMADGTIRTLPTLLIREVRIGRHTVRTVRAGVSSTTGEMLDVANAVAGAAALSKFGGYDTSLRWVSDDDDSGDAWQRVRLHAFINGRGRVRL